MELKWTSKAFLIWRGYMIFWCWPVNLLPQNGAVPDTGAGHSVNSSTYGEQLFQFEPREVRRIFVGEYESVTNLMARLFMYCACGTHEKQVDCVWGQL